jgi:hypothetical protein
MNLFQFQDKKKTKYFEGWYTRLTDHKNNLNLAIIFAITKDPDNPHAFIQVYDGIKKTNQYIAFDYDMFHYDNDKQVATIKDNQLSASHLVLNTANIEIDITFDSLLKNNKSAMSFLRKMPLECFQEILILDGQYSGNITYLGTEIKSSGKLYQEKTYGTNFPNKWIWLQSNHPARSNASITLAIGMIPLKKMRVKGFFLLIHHQETTYRFASYNMSKVIIEEYNGNITLSFVKKGYKAIIKTNVIDPVKLVGPRKDGKMDLEVFESINSEAHLTLYHKKDIILEDTFTKTGLEYMWK